MKKIIEAPVLHPFSSLTQNIDDDLAQDGDDDDVTYRGWSPVDDDVSFSSDDIELRDFIRLSLTEPEKLKNNTGAHGSTRVRMGSPSNVRRA
jgi:hypothetical protein